MIHKIWASDKRFKPVEFSSGLNIIIAERTPESGQKDTRNGAGKTTLLNIIHFCFGADLSRLSLPKNELSDWIFYISMDLCGKTMIAKRSIVNSKIIEVETESDALPIAPEKDSDGNQFYSNNNWKELLGRCLFKIQGDTAAKYAPTFRSLVPYFSRRGVDAYADPFKPIRDYKAYQVQIYNAYLLGLNWLHASEAEELKQKAKAVKALSGAIKVGIVPSQGELEADRVRIERELNQEADAINSFKVHPQYKELQEQANHFTSQLHEHINKTILLRRKLDRYERTVSEEKTPNDSSVEKLFTNAGIHFSENMKRSLSEAKVFHTTIVQNRKLFLESEITQLKITLASAEENIEDLTDRRAELMQLLMSHGALEEFALIQDRATEKKGQLETIRNKLSDIREIAKHNKEIKAEKLKLETKLQRDYELSRNNWEKAVTLFNENSQALYDEPGNLIINTTENGYKFDVEIQKSSSEGVGKMKIFCYDLMLIELMNQRGGMDFLFHDSSMFDGVDSRQKALALMHAHKKALENNFQYICAFNSDMIPSDDFDDDFNIDKFVRLTLKDQKPEDGILGFHFELAKKG